MNTPSLLIEFILTVVILNYFTSKEASTFSSILAQDYRSGDFNDDELFTIDGIKFV